MRLPRSALLLALAACSIENPAFKLGPQDTGGSAGDTTTTGRTTGPDPTTAAATTTLDPGVSSTSGASGTPVSTSEPGTSDATTGPPGPDLPGECNFTAVGDIKMYAYNETMRAPLEGCGGAETWVGPARMEGGKFFITDAGMCESMEEHPEYSLGDQYPSDQPDRTFKCAQVLVNWHPAEPGKCRVGTLRVINKSGMVPEYTVYAASFNHPVEPPGLEFWPDRVLERQCGCDDAPGCCQPEDAGEYALEPFPGILVAPGAEVPLAVAGHDYRFVNIQSHVDGSCQEADPNNLDLGKHFDWFGEEDLGP